MADDEVRGGCAARGVAARCAEPPVRLMKLIGDAAMFVSAEVEPGTLFADAAVAEGTEEQ